MLCNIAMCRTNKILLADGFRYLGGEFLCWMLLLIVGSVGNFILVQHIARYRNAWAKSAREVGLVSFLYPTSDVNADRLAQTTNKY